MSTSSKRIAQNTILLYVRTFVILLLSLYTSREVLRVLGEDDFGIYNVVGGVVVLFTFLTQALTTSTQRYLNFSIGKRGDTHRVFCVSMLAHLAILGLVFVLSETIGLWFVSTQMNIPADRVHAMHWVYQMSILATLINLIVVPYRASIIAMEKMEYFAYVSIFDVIMKLVIVLILPLFDVDQLILYSILFTFVSLLTLLLYKDISRRNLSFTRFEFIYDRKLFKEMLQFSGWYLLGGAANITAKQGVNILINIFCGVAVNAAVGIANQVRSAIMSFVSSFQTAFNPQIVKLYAEENFNKLISLINRSTKFSYFLYFIMAFPLIICCDLVLDIWLINVPQYAISFTRLVIIAAVLDVLSNPLWTAIGATGEVQKYQIFVSVILILSLPFSFIALSNKMSPPIVFMIDLAINLVAYIFRLFYVKKYIKYSIKAYIKETVLPCMYVTLISSAIPIILMPHIETLISKVLLAVICVFISLGAIYITGLDYIERKYILSFIKSKIGKKQL